MGRNILSKINTGTQELLASKENGVGVLTMNRPEARNAMSGEMNAAMQEMLAQFCLLYTSPSPRDRG